MLELENVTIKFGGLIAVNNVSIKVEKGEICGLIGPNGAGKTTLFNLISGVFKPTEGKILFLGQQIQDKQSYKICKLGIARTYQNINLFRNMTVLENLLVGYHCRMNTNLIDNVLYTKRQLKEETEARDRGMEILRFVGLAENAHEDARNLSYGKQRILEIARAMASQPKLLLLDEPAAGMNSTEKIELMDCIQKIREKGITILIVDHNMRLIMGVAEMIYVLNYGKLIAEGSPEEIQRNEQVINAYLGS